MSLIANPLCETTARCGCRFLVEVAAEGDSVTLDHQFIIIDIAVNSPAEPGDTLPICARFERRERAERHTNITQENHTNKDRTAAVRKRA